MNVEYKTVIRYHNRCNAFKVKNKKKKKEEMLIVRHYNARITILTCISLSERVGYKKYFPQATVLKMEY